MSISEDQIARLVHDHILGIITEEDEQQLQEWIASDPTHRDYVAHILDRNDLARRYRNYSKANDKRAWKAFRTYTSDTTFHFWRYAVSTAAVLLLLFGIGFYLNNSSKPGSGLSVNKTVALSPQQSKARQQAVKSGRQSAHVIVNGKEYVISSPSDYAKVLAETPADEEWEIKTKAGKEYWLTLPDGSQVHLDNNSQLKYPSSFAQNHREVELEGTAFFKIAHQADAPFTISTHDGIITDLGTEFFVNTHSQGHTEVVLFSGRVGVRQTGTPVGQRQAEAILRPGQRAVIQGNNISLSAADLDFYKAWNEGVFLFRNTSLSKMMDVVGHWYNVDIEFARPEYSNMTFTGSADRYGSLDAILDAVHLVTGLPVTRKDNKIIIGRKN